jgi:ferrous iron transport protein A
MQALQNTMSFAALRKGMKGRIVSCPNCTPDCIRLQEMGLTPGAEFKVVKVAPFGDPIEIDLRGYRLCLRKQESKLVEFELVE